MMPAKKTTTPIAVKFDTYKNKEFQTPNNHHIVINYGSIISHQTVNLVDARISDLHEGAIARAWIRFDSSKHLMVVHLKLAKEGSHKPIEPLLISVSLKISHILKEYMFVGFSGGAIGKLGHLILSNNGGSTQRADMRACTWHSDS
ncbi:hypothetical protein L7F22_016824 [Adiantum nelumboides]|nr:hypothetical protein [Adiantum nelumboides]